MMSKTMKIARKEPNIRRGKRLATSTSELLTFVEKEVSRKNVTHFVFKHDKFGNIRMKMNIFPFLAPVNLEISRRDKIGQINALNLDFLRSQIDSLAKMVTKG